MSREKVAMNDSSMIRFLLSDFSPAMACQNGKNAERRG
jgi:hypothetical protein